MPGAQRAAAFDRQRLAVAGFTPLQQRLAAPHGAHPRPPRPEAGVQPAKVGAAAAHGVSWAMALAPRLMNAVMQHEPVDPGEVGTVADRLEPGGVLAPRTVARLAGEGFGFQDGVTAAGTRVGERLGIGPSRAAAVRPELRHHPIDEGGDLAHGPRPVTEMPLDVAEHLSEVKLHGQPTHLVAREAAGLPLIGLRGGALRRVAEAVGHPAAGRSVPLSAAGEVDHVLGRRLPLGGGQ